MLRKAHAPNISRSRQYFVLLLPVVADGVAGSAAEAFRSPAQPAGAGAHEGSSCLSAATVPTMPMSLGVPTAAPTAEPTDDRGPKRAAVGEARRRSLLLLPGHASRAPPVAIARVDPASVVHVRADLSRYPWAEVCPASGPPPPWELALYALIMLQHTVLDDALRRGVASSRGSAAAQREALRERIRSTTFPSEVSSHSAPSRAAPARPPSPSRPRAVGDRCGDRGRFGADPIGAGRARPIVDHGAVCVQRLLGGRDRWAHGR